MVVKPPFLIERIPRKHLNFDFDFGEYFVPVVFSIIFTGLIMMLIGSSFEKEDKQMTAMCSQLYGSQAKYDRNAGASNDIDCVLKDGSLKQLTNEEVKNAKKD